MITLKESILTDTKSKVKNIGGDIRKPETALNIPCKTFEDVVNNVAFCLGVNNVKIGKTSARWKQPYPSRDGIEFYNDPCVRFDFYNSNGRKQRSIRIAMWGSKLVMQYLSYSYHTVRPTISSAALIGVWRPYDWKMSLWEWIYNSDKYMKRAFDDIDKFNIVVPKK
jgi:hypothetical protein